MYILSKKQINVVAAGRCWVYVTPQWKSADASAAGYLGGTIGLGMGALTLFVNPCYLALATSLILGSIGYGIGYSIVSLANYPLENYTWYDSKDIEPFTYKNAITNSF